MTDGTPLSGRAALVTGASSGIGRATADALADDGADVALAARRGDRLERVAGEIATEHGVEAVPVPTDVREEEGVEAMVGTAVDRFGRLDIVVNNAGTGRGHGPVTDVETEDYRAAMETNVDGTFFTTRAALPHLIERDGNLVFVASLAGRYPFPLHPLYGAAKAWTRSFAHSVEASVGPEGVAVTVVNPGGVRTGFEVREGTPQRENYDEGEVPEPAEVADAVAMAARADPSTTISEVDVYPRDQLGRYY